MVIHGFPLSFNIKQLLPGLGFRQFSTAVD